MARRRRPGARAGVRLVRRGRGARRRRLRRPRVRHRRQHGAARSGAHRAEPRGDGPRVPHRDRRRPGRAEPGTAHGQGRRAIGRQGHHDRPLGDVRDRPGPAVPHLPRRVPPRGHRAVRGGPSAARSSAIVPASGTEIIDRLGEEHLRTGRPIVYTSGDSVFQIAHPRGRGPARDAVRVVPGRPRHPGRRAPGGTGHRPAVRGEPGAFARTPDRRDFSVPPPGPHRPRPVRSRRGSPSTGSARSGTSSTAAD